jgi:nicotinate-nucleotide adenylyltransferase
MVKLGNKLTLKKKIKIGILGGSFDPAHEGHLAISKEAKKKFRLKNIIWTITKKNPLKNKSNLSVKKRINFAKKIIKLNNTCVMRISNFNHV